jgi:plastocyanin
MYRIWSLSVYCILFHSYIFGQTNVTLHLNAGEIAIGNTQIPKLVFNSTSQFGHQNAIISVPVGETINFTIFNNDLLPHEISIEGLSESIEVNSGGSSELSVQFETLEPFHCDQYPIPVECWVQLQ